MEKLSKREFALFNATIIMTMVFNVIIIVNEIPNLPKNIIIISTILHSLHILLSLMYFLMLFIMSCRWQCIVHLESVNRIKLLLGMIFIGFVARGANLIYTLIFYTKYKSQYKLYSDPYIIFFIVSIVNILFLIYMFVLYVGTKIVEIDLEEENNPI